MQEADNHSKLKIDNQKIIENKELNIYEALIPVVILMGLLAYNIFLLKVKNGLELIQIKSFY